MANRDRKGKVSTIKKVQLRYDLKEIEVHKLVVYIWLKIFGDLLAIDWKINKI